MSEGFVLRLGAASPTIYDQTEKFGMTTAEAKVFQDDSQAISRAYIRGYLTEAEVKKARARLGKVILKYLHKIMTEKRQAGHEPHV